MSERSPLSLFKETFFDSRRKFLQSSGQASLSAIAVGALSGCVTSLQADSADPEGDITILNTAIAAEHEAIAAYQLGAESGLLDEGVLSVAVKFQGHHKEHADVLASTVQQLGGHPADPKAEYTFPVEKLKGQTDVLEFAAGLERGAVSAYAGAIPLFDNRDLSKAAASILADEAMHWAILRNALGLDPVPGAFFS